MVVYGFLSYFDGEVKIPNRELMVKFEDVFRMIEEARSIAVAGRQL